MSEARAEVFHSDDDDSCDTTSKWRLPDSWAWTSLSDVSELIFGQSPPSSTYNSEQRGLPFFQGKAEFGTVHPKVVKYCTAATRTAEVGDILMSIRAPVGPTNVADRRCGVGRGLAAIRARGEIDPSFLRYFLNRTEANLAAQGTGTTFSAITKRVLVSHPVAIAPLKEQRRISSKIDELFSEIEAGERALKRARAALARYRKSVLKAAVTGDLTADWRAANKDRLEPADKLLTRILAARREAWEKAERAKLKAQGKAPKGEEWRKKYREPAEPHTAELRALPDCWTWATVDQLSTKVTDGVHKKPNYVDQGVPFVTVKNLTAGPGITFDDLNYVAHSDHLEFIKRTHPERGDILISKDGTLGVTRVIKTDRVFSIFVSVALIKPVNRTMGDYFGVALASPIVQQQMVPVGTGLQHIHLVDLRRDCIPLCSLDEQTEVVSRVEEAFSKANHVEAALDAQERAARALKQSILKAAFVGRLVPQDPNDEPAAKLLERISASAKLEKGSGAASKAKVGRRRSN